MAVLVAGRAVQGLGAGFVPTVAYVAISRGYPERCRPRMFAVLSTAWVVPGLVGPAVAALVATTVGWRWAFLGLIPLVMVAGSLAVVALGQVPPLATARKAPTSYLPVLAVVLGTGVALASLGSGDVPVMAIGAVGGGTLLVLSLRRLTPPGTLVAAKGLPATIVGRGLLTCCFFAGSPVLSRSRYAVIPDRPHSAMRGRSLRRGRRKPMKGARTPRAAAALSAHREAPTSPGRRRQQSS